MKKETGSIVLFATVSMICLIAFVIGIYVTKSNLEIVSLEETNRIKEIYEKNINNKDGMYQTLLEIGPVTTTGYVKNGLLLHYDAINNTGTGVHDPIATSWADLSGNGNNGILTGGTWQNNYLYFDGVDDTVDTGLYASTTFSTTSDYTLSIVFKINSVPSTNTTYGNTGVIFGAMYYCGYGIVWDRRTTSNLYNLIAISRAETSKSIRLESNVNVNDNMIFVIDYIYSSLENTTSAYLNGKLINKSTALTGEYGYPTDMGNIRINKNQIYGGSFSRTYAEMNCYSAKIYERALTDAEIASNYQIDKARFGL